MPSKKQQIIATSILFVAILMLASTDVPVKAYSVMRDEYRILADNTIHSHQPILPAKGEYQSKDIPVDVFVIREPHEIASYKSDDIIRRDLENASAILNQVGVSIHAAQITSLKLKEADYQKPFESVIFSLLKQSPSYNPDHYSVVLARKYPKVDIVRPGGFAEATYGKRIVVFDISHGSASYQALAHEFSHLLGLKDTYGTADEAENNLMSATGTGYTDDEVKTIRTYIDSGFIKPEQAKGDPQILQ